MDAVCSKCQILKSLSSYSKDKSKKSGFATICKPCRAEYQKSYQVKTRKTRLAYLKDYRAANAEKIKIDKAVAYTNNKEKRLESAKLHYKENAEAKKVWQTAYRIANADKIQANVRARKKRDPKFKLRLILGTRLGIVLRQKSMKKTTKFSQYIGCSLEELKLHIENQFVAGMSWENHGKWHVDHIKPLINAKTEEEMYLRCHYTNLQPLWAADNIRKSNKE